MERIGTLTSENGVAEVLFRDGVFTLGESEQVTPSQLFAWSDEGRLRWEREGMAEWVRAFAAEAPLAPAARKRRLGPIILTVAAAAIVLAVGGIAGSALGRQALTQDRARSEKALATAKRDADTAERKVMMFGEAIQSAADGSSVQQTSSDGNLTIDVVKPEQPQTQQQKFSQYCRVKASYTGGGFSSETAWVHFKTVDAQGRTVKEALGSDEMNMRKEHNGPLAQTAKRRQLVDALRHMMTSAGWTEIGVSEGGEWYQYEFGRSGGD
jgi:hypothetical protein